MYTLKSLLLSLEFYETISKKKLMIFFFSTPYIYLILDDENLNYAFLADLLFEYLSLVVKYIFASTKTINLYLRYHFLSNASSYSPLDGVSRLFIHAVFFQRYIVEFL